MRWRSRAFKALRRGRSHKTAIALLPATVVLFTGTAVVSWKLHTGDWNTAFALGSFLVGMAAAVATLRHV